MARDSSPLSQRLKALAVRAGLPVDAGNASREPASPAATPDDEQPTGEFAAVAASDTPAEDQATGEFPAVSDEPAAEPVEPAPVAETLEPLASTEPSTEAQPAADAEPESISDAEPALHEEADAAPDLPTPPDPIWQTAAVPPPVRDEAPAPAPAPIWTDAPPESQSPLGATPTDGPTLPPPTLSKSAELNEALALPDDETTAPVQATGDEPSAADEPTEQPTIVQPAVPTTPEIEPTTTVFSPISVVADQTPAMSEAPSTDEQADAAAEVPTDAASAEPTPATDEPVAAEPAAEAPSQKTSARERLSLTGRFAALKRRVAPPADQPGGAAAAGDDAAAAAAVAAAATAATTQEPSPATAAPATPVPAPVHVYATPPEPPAAKPSFSERAALRRRVKTLRARRDTGLLELGAIVLDQRRFGDPTAGALLRRRTDELGDLDNEIAAIEHALDDHASAAAVAALGTIRCVGCGSLVGPGDRFCAQCGVPRPTGDAASNPPADPAS